MANFKKREDGLWDLDMSLGTDTMTGKRIRITRRGFKTKKEATEAASKIRQEHANGHVVISQLTVAGFVPEFLQWYKQQVKQHTYETRERAIKAHVLPYFGDKLINKISVTDIHNWQQHLLNELKLSAGTVKLYHQVFSKMYRRAMALGHVTKNILDVAGNVRYTHAKVEFWTYQQAKIFIEWLDQGENELLKVFYRTLFFTGIRFGEAQGLKWRDFDFQLQTLNIERTMHYKSPTSYYTNSPKSKSSMRIIPIDETLAFNLFEWQQKQRLLVPGVNPESFIFTDVDYPQARTYFSVHIDKFLKEDIAGGFPRITPHGFRHSHVAFLIYLKQDPVTIQRRLGHESIEITLGTYGHLYPERGREVSDVLGKFSL